MQNPFVAAPPARDEDAAADRQDELGIFQDGGQAAQPAERPIGYTRRQPGLQVEARAGEIATLSHSGRMQQGGLVGGKAGATRASQFEGARRVLHRSIAQGVERGCRVEGAEPRK